ncbi:hypothetical protein TNCT_159341 [Trichonephila clavata]|uniref:Uncharacterized protein n=1 Tax=Trichonephila clavata TaxID=2740835 RepID=A0A8X6LL28_TRICU|nr:hypothetical protein TNCT_159341 [Trichonephila clavata]
MIARKRSAIDRVYIPDSNSESNFSLDSVLYAVQEKMQMASKIAKKHEYGAKTVKLELALNPATNSIILKCISKKMLCRFSSIFTSARSLY